MRPLDLYRTPNALAGHYSRFRVRERHLLTGHSHQAWPDRARDAQIRAWDDAAEQVDEKWERAFEEADRVRRGFGRLLGEAPEHLALGQNTHELVVRFLSALPLRTRPRLVTTHGEFHTVRRQLERLEEEGLEIVRVPVDPVDAIPTRIEAALDDRTAAAIVSSVLFENARIVPGFDRMAARCRRVGARLLVDAYHHLNIVPFSIEAMDLGDAFVVGGGYKYCQLGEGNCFLRVPPDPSLRPVITGWFAEFGAVLDEGRAEADPTGPTSSDRRDPDGAGVTYGPGPARFAGATYDPTSHYRGAAVFDFFEEMGLAAPLLREVSRHQVELLARRFDELDADPHVISRNHGWPLERTAGFLPLRASRADVLVRLLREEGVFADQRGGILRLGPAPYLSDRQIEEAVAALGTVLLRLDS